MIWCLFHRFLFETRRMIDFEIGNTRYGVPVPVPRPPGDFPLTELSARPGFGFFLHKHFLVASKGGDVTQNIDFQKEEVSLQGPKFLKEAI